MEDVNFSSLSKFTKQPRVNVSHEGANVCKCVCSFVCLQTNMNMDTIY